MTPTPEERAKALADYWPSALDRGPFYRDVLTHIVDAVAEEREACALAIHQTATHYSKILAGCTDEVALAFGHARIGECLENVDAIRARGKP